MDLEQYIKTVRARLPELSEQDAEAVNRSIKQLYERNFSIDNAVAFSLCTEEVSPRLDEMTAVRRMNVILDRHNNRK